MASKKSKRGVPGLKRGARFSLLGSFMVLLIIAAVAGLLCAAPAKTDAQVFRRDSSADQSRVARWTNGPVSGDIRSEDLRRMD